MTLLILQVAAALVLVIVALIIAIRSFTKDSIKKQSPFLMTEDDISNNLRSWMLSINHSEYMLGYRSEAEYAKFIEDIDNRLMRG